MGHPTQLRISKTLLLVNNGTQVSFLSEGTIPLLSPVCNTSVCMAAPFPKGHGRGNLELSLHLNYQSLS